MQLRNKRRRGEPLTDGEQAELTAYYGRYNDPARRHLQPGPAVIFGNSNTPAALGLVMPLLHWAMPSRFHSIRKNDLARAMVAQSEQASTAILQCTAPTTPAVKVLEYDDMKTFFKPGDRDAR